MDDSKKRIWGWWAYDWASQPYFTLGLTFVFGPYFASIASDAYLASGLDEQAADAQAQSIWSLMLTIVGLFIAISAPVMGAISDNTGKRRPWIFFFSLLMVIGGIGLWFTYPDGSTLTLALFAFAICMLGLEYSLIFTNAYLPELGPRDQLGRIGGTGYALGYSGGVLALFIMLLVFMEQDNGKTFFLGLDPAFGLLDAETREGTRAVGPFMAIWYVLFMIPFFLWVPDLPGTTPKTGSIGSALRKLTSTIRSLPARPSLFSFLGSSMLYRDGMNALYGFGGTYAVLVLNWNITLVGVFGIVAAIASAILCYFGGKLDSRLGPKPVIRAMIFILIGVCLFMPGLSETAIWGIESAMVTPVFMICGCIIGGAGGILQAASRTLMVRHADPDQATEYFGLYGLAGKATAFIGPMMIGGITYLTGDVRLGVAPMATLFILGLVLLAWVNAEGDQAPA